MSTFDRIQSSIITPSCASAGCHSSGSAFAQSSGLVLDRGVAFQNLVNAVPKNAAARNDGLLRVTPGNPDLSLLMHKLVADPSHHVHDYGSLMPLGSDPLLNGQVEFVKRWILAGAPETGNVVDEAVLADKSKQTVAPFVPLPAPASGIQLHIAPFSISPNFEREFFLFEKLSNPTDLFVNRIESRMRINSHHFVLYTFDPSVPAFLLPAAGQIRDIRNADGSMNLINMLPMGFHIFFAGAATPNSDYRFPDGVALRVPAGAGLDLNSHYVNRTNAAITGEVYANLHTMPAAQVEHEAQTLNMGNQSIVLPPRTRTTLTKTFINNDATLYVFMLTSHMHQTGEKFVIRISGGARDGEIVYTNLDWAHPDMTSYPQPLAVHRGEGLTSEITWNNTTDRTIRFGLTSQDEMGIIFGYFYR